MTIQTLLFIQLNSNKEGPEAQEHAPKNLWVKKTQIHHQKK